MSAIAAAMVGARFAGAAPVVYHSPLDDGTPTTVPLVIADGGSAWIHLYVRTGVSPSSDPTGLCIDADGDEICGTRLALSTTGAVTFTVFVPEPTADVVWALAPAAFGANVLDPIAPAVGTHRLGSLQVVASPGQCPPHACLVTLDATEVVAADLGVAEADLATPSPTVAVVPEPESLLGLGSGLLLLAALGSLTRARPPSRRRRRIVRRIAAVGLRSTCGGLVAVLALSGVARAVIGPCGDVDVDTTLSSTDLALYRAHLADPAGSPLPAGGAARCAVAEGSSDCDLLGAVVLARRLAAPLAGPGIAPVCAAVAPLDLQPTLAAERDVRFVDAAGEDLAVTASDGTVYRLTIPPGAIGVSGGVIVEMRVVSSLPGFPGSGGLHAGVELLPDGLVLDQTATLRIEFASPPPATELAFLEYTDGGASAYFVPILLDTTGPVTAVDWPIRHFSGHTTVGATPDEIASTPVPFAIDDARRMQQLASLAETAVQYGLLGLDFLSNPDAERTAGKTVREWLDEITARVYSSYASCSDLYDISRSLLTWGALDTLFGVQLAQSTEQEDITLWQTIASAVGGTSGVVAGQYQAAADYCAQPTSDPCNRFLVRRDTERCRQQGNAVLNVLQLPPLDPTLIDMDALCRTAPSTATFVRADTVASGPFEACPADPSFDVTADVYDHNGDPVPGAGPFSFSSSNSAVLTATPNASGASVTPAGGLGPVVLEGEWTSCPEFTSATNVFVGVAPKLVGGWLAAGTEEQTGCFWPDENYPPTYGEVAGEIEAQITNPDGSVDFNVFGSDWEGIANLECGGVGAVFSGQQPYTFEGGYGITSYAGVLTGLSGTPGHRIATSFETAWISQDLAGDSCVAEGSATMSRTN